jgi:hypothetical protein
MPGRSAWFEIAEGESLALHYPPDMARKRL